MVSSRTRQRLSWTSFVPKRDADLSDLSRNSSEFDNYEEEYNFSKYYYDWAISKFAILKLCFHFGMLFTSKVPPCAFWGSKSLLFPSLHVTFYFYPWIL